MRPVPPADPSAVTTRVGIRELRQSLSTYIRRIRRGEQFEVTDRGRGVALLVPLRPGLSPLERLIAEGRATRPAGDLLDVPAPVGPAGTKVSEALMKDREERR